MKPELFEYDALSPTSQVKARQAAVADEIRAYRRDLEEVRAIFRENLHGAINDPMHIRRLVNASNLLRKLECPSYLERFIRENLCHFSEDGRYYLYCGRCFIDANGVLSDENSSQSEQPFNLGFGTVIFDGKEYALQTDAFQSCRLFPGWWGDAAIGEEYLDEWEAPAIDRDGNEYRIYWRFAEIRGQENEDASLYDWSTPSAVEAA